jgi:hypothetical protein
VPIANYAQFDRSGTSISLLRLRRSAASEWPSP